jgi:hypothetical protein
LLIFKKKKGGNQFWTFNEKTTFSFEFPILQEKSVENSFHSLLLFVEYFHVPNKKERKLGLFSGEKLSQTFEKFFKLHPNNNNSRSSFDNEQLLTRLGLFFKTLTMPPSSGISPKRG